MESNPLEKENAKQNEPEENQETDNQESEGPRASDAQNERSLATGIPLESKSEKDQLQLRLREQNQAFQHEKEALETKIESITKQYEAEELKTRELESQQTLMKMEMMTNAQEQLHTIESLKKEVATKTDVFTAQNRIFDQLNERYQVKEQKVLDQANIISDMTAQLQKQAEDAALFEEGMQEKLVQLEAKANVLVSENKELNQAKECSQEIQDKLNRTETQLHEAVAEKKQLEVLCEEQNQSIKVMEEQAKEMIKKICQEMDVLEARNQEMDQLGALAKQNMEEKSKELAAAQIELEEQKERFRVQLEDKNKLFLQEKGQHVEEMSKLAKEKARFQNLLDVQAKTFQSKSEKDKSRHAEEMDLAIKKVEHHLAQQLKHCQLKLDEEKVHHAEALRNETAKYQTKLQLQVQMFKKELQQGQETQQEQMDASKKETHATSLQLKTLGKDNGQLQDRIADLKKQKMSVQEQAGQYLKQRDDMRNALGGIVLSLITFSLLSRCV